MAEYAVARKLQDEPAFAWWTSHVLRKRNMIIASINSRVRKASHKYGFEVPKSVKDAYRIDRDNGDTYWSDALKKEMRLMQTLILMVCCFLLLWARRERSGGLWKQKNQGIAGGYRRRSLA